MSTRAIAAATGISDTTVRRDLSGATNAAPDSVTGKDGKIYAPSKFTAQPPNSGCAEEKAAPTRKRRPITEAFDTTRYELAKKAESLARLVADDRFGRYAEQLAQSHRSDLIRARNAIQVVIDHLPDPTVTRPEEG